MHYIGKLDKNIYKCVTCDITTDEVIITNERIKHIIENHPKDYEKIHPFLQAAIETPDYILEDKNPNTGLVLKEIEENGMKIQVVLRLHTSEDLEKFKNSVISAWIIRNKEYGRLIRNKKILYKRV